MELFSLTKSYNMAGWRVGFVLGNPELVAALTQIKSYLDYGIFQPIQIASIIALNGPQDCVADIVGITQKRRDTLIRGLNRIGWEVEKPKATMFVWAKIPDGLDKTLKPAGGRRSGRERRSASRWSSPSFSSKRAGWPSLRGSGLENTATATSGSRWWRTSTGSARRSRNPQGAVVTARASDPRRPHRLRDGGGRRCEDPYGERRSHRAAPGRADRPGGNRRQGPHAGPRGQGRPLAVDG